MGSRLDLHQLFVELLGSSNVYYQAPANTTMQYPAIRYSRTKPNINRANDGIYMYKKAYEVTVIDRNPDSEIVDRIMQLPLCSYDRHYVTNNLNHDTFTIYY